MTRNVAHSRTRSVPLLEGTDVHRFLRQVDVSSECWIWSGSKQSMGYGTFGIGRYPSRRTFAAHRVSFRYFVGEIPDGAFVLHRCDVRDCVNPQHLFIGDDKANAEDRDSKGRGNYSRGEKCGMAKLTEDSVAEIRRLHLMGLSGPRIAEIFSVTNGNIWFIVKNRTWKHVQPARS